MEIVFLGTGSAWCVPEHSCDCAVCVQMKALGELRTRTAILIRGAETVLVDCGPDIRSQMISQGVQRPDLILITHEHADHFLGLDDLLAFRRSTPPDAWTPIPVYATEEAWKAIELRFGYLVGSLIEKRFVLPGSSLERQNMRITPFKTDHGASAPGSVGYVIEERVEKRWIKVVYTSDFVRLNEEPEILHQPDVLIMQSHWFNEPIQNRPSHMSFQFGKEYIKRWSPTTSTYLVHLSDGDQVPGDLCNSYLKKIPPRAPLADPNSMLPYPVPRSSAEWQEVVEKVCKDYGLPEPVVVARDGMRITLE